MKLEIGLLRVPNMYEGDKVYFYKQEEGILVSTSDSLENQIGSSVLKRGFTIDVPSRVQEELDDSWLDIQSKSDEGILLNIITDL